MMVLLYTDQSYAPGCYLLSPVNKRIARRFEKQTGEDSVLFQSDQTWTALAQSLGWRGADHELNKAIKWLDDHENHVFRVMDCQYFE